MKNNRLTLTLLVLVLIAAVVLIGLRFADAGTRGRLYGWLPGTATQTQPIDPTRRGR